MENGIIIYYSLEGNTEYVSELLSEKLAYDLVKLEPVEDIDKKGFKRYLIGGSQVIKKKEPILKEYNLELENYHNIILASPVWAGSFVPAFRSFFKKEKTNLINKNVSFVACHDGGPGKIIENFKNEISENYFFKELLLKKTLKNKEKSTEIILQWSKEYLDEL